MSAVAAADDDDDDRDDRPDRRSGSSRHHRHRRPWWRRLRRRIRKKFKGAPWWLVLVPIGALAVAWLAVKVAASLADGGDGGGQP